MRQSLLTVKEVSSFLRVHPKTVYKWKATGRLPFINLNGKIRFKDSKIEEFIENKTPNNPEIAKFLPNIDLSLETYDRMLLKGRSALGKNSKRWNYGFGGVYIRKTKSGTERWYIWYYNEKRKRVQKIVKNAVNRQQAVVALHMEVTTAFNREYRKEKEQKRIPFSEFANLYLENYAKLKKRSWRSDQKYLKAQLTPYFGKMELLKITQLHVHQFIVKRQRDGVKNSTINRELTVLKKMLNLAIEWGFEIERNPVAKGKFFSEEEYRRNRVLTDEEEKRLFHVAAPHLRPVLTCALSTAMRYTEILGLRWENVDLVKRQITIKAESSKTGKRRVVPINDTLFAELGKLKKLNSGASPFVFLYEDPKTGKRRPVKTVRRAFLMACRRACIKDLTFHDLRHTVGSRLISKGTDPVSVKNILGHSNLKTTEIYLHSNMKQMREAVERLDEKPKSDAENLQNLLPICNSNREENSGKPQNSLFSMN